jgi:hypothetical protein
MKLLSIERVSGFAPTAERKIEAPANKKMNVIRHNHIASDANPPDFTLLGKMNQRVTHASVCQNFPALMCVERNKIQWWIVAMEHLMQSRRSISHGQNNVVEALVPSA